MVFTSSITGTLKVDEVKHNAVLKKLAWGLLLMAAILLLAASVTYYTLFLHHKQQEASLKEGKRVTLVIATNEVDEGRFSTIKKEDLPAKLADEAEEDKGAVEPEKKIEQEKKEAVPAVTQPAKTGTAVKPQLPVDKKDVKKSTAHAASTPHKEEQQKAEPAAPQSIAVAPAVTPAAQKEKKPDTARVALLMGGLGLSKSSTESALTLPPEVTIGLSPYSLDIKQWAEMASKHGNEIFINVPMEAADSPVDDPGSFALVTTLDTENNLKRLDWVLSRVGGYAGVYSDADEKFSESQSSVRPILYELKKRNLMFIYGGGYGNTSFMQLAKNIDQQVVISDLVIDTKISADRIKESLDALEQSAKKNGYALGMGAPYPITIKMLEQWIPTLKEKGIELVPVSMLLQNKGHP